MSAFRWFGFSLAGTLVACGAPSEEAASETTATAPAGGQNYTVQSGDTLFEIGQKFGVDWKKIAEINNLEAPYSLTVGKTLLIPEKTSSTE